MMAFNNLEEEDEKNRPTEVSAYIALAYTKFQLVVKALILHVGDPGFIKFFILVEKQRPLHLVRKMGSYVL